MEGFQMNFKKGPARRRRRTQFVPRQDERPRTASAFGDDHDSDDDKPRVKPVTRIENFSGDIKIANNDQGKKQVQEHGKRQGQEAKTSYEGERKSQIAKLVSRRKDAAAELQNMQASGSTDEAIFRYDIEECPEQASLSAYKQTPVDGFGAAMLKAMGWKGPQTDASESDNATLKRLERKPRPPRLGLGASLGAGPSKRPRLDQRNSDSNGVAQNEGTKHNLPSEDEAFTETVQTENSNFPEQGILATGNFTSANGTYGNAKSTGPLDSKK